MENVLQKQKEFYKTGKTLDIQYRIKSLKLLKESIFNNLEELVIAFKEDYNKCEFDVYSTEVGLVVKEINYFIKNLKRLSKPKRVRTSLINFPSKGYILSEPYGNTLIVSPWNYPFQLTMMPLVASMGCGNTIVLKSSRNTPRVTKVIEKILRVFDDEYIYVMENTKENMDRLFDLKFDYIFYTGSPNVAKELMEKQAKYLTPMTLELGGKSPCIIDKTANIEKSAKRVVWGKFLNAGQTCVAPDYVLVHNDVKREFMKHVIKYIQEFYYTNNELSNDFTCVINEKILNKLMGLIDKEKLVFGGNISNNTLEPTVLEDIGLNDEIMKEEIFGPIMPVIEFNNLEDVINYLKDKDKPLALYYFGKEYKKVLKNVSFGGGCINDTIMHLTEEKLPFGGVGLSGMGSYHGKKSFEVFSHQKSILKKHLKLEVNLKYPKYSEKKTKLTKMFFGIKNIKKR